MKSYTASQARTNLSRVITEAQEEPIEITKDGTPRAVILSAARFTELQYLEDKVFVKAAELAIQEGFVSQDDAIELFSQIGANGNAD